MEKFTKEELLEIFTSATSKTRLAEALGIKTKNGTKMNKEIEEYASIIGFDTSLVNIRNKRRNLSKQAEDEYNKHPAKLCLNFYDILIRQIIYEYVKNGKANAEPPFIYPYYLYLICDALAVDEEKYVGTYVESFWNDLMSTLSDLLKVHEDHNIHLYYVDLLNILKSLIMISDYSAERKTELLTWLSTSMSLKRICTGIECRNAGESFLAGLLLSVIVLTL